MPALVTTVRSGVVSRLIAAATSAGSRVEDSRVREFAVSAAGAATTETFPRVIVRSTGLRRTIRGQRSTTVEVTCLFAVECYALATGNDIASAAAALETLEQACFVALWDDGSWLADAKGPPVVGQTEVSAEVTGSRTVVYSSTPWEFTVTADRTQLSDGDDLVTVAVDLQSVHDSGDTLTDASTIVDDLDQ